MKDTEQQWHTYENKLTRPIKVIARHLDPSGLPREVVGDLERRGFNILNLINKTKIIVENGKTQIKPLPLCMLTFSHEEDICKIYNIYLSDRTQVVKYRDCFSNEVLVKIGVQGTILGPLLFVLYINDIFRIVEDDCLVSYADDTAILCSGNTWIEAQNIYEY